jgi:hypothetical protein
VAGLLNQGLVIYEPFWHPPQKAWLNHEQAHIGIEIQKRLS